MYAPPRNPFVRVKPLAPDSPAPVLDTHFRLLRQDFVEPLREAVLGYRREQLKAQDVGVMPHQRVDRLNRMGCRWDC